MPSCRRTSSLQLIFPDKEPDKSRSYLNLMYVNPCLGESLLHPFCGEVYPFIPRMPAGWLADKAQHSTIMELLKHSVYLLCTIIPTSHHHRRHRRLHQQQQRSHSSAGPFVGIAELVCATINLRWSSPVQAGAHLSEMKFVIIDCYSARQVPAARKQSFDSNHMQLN